MPRFAAVAHSGRGKDAKIKSAQAAKICPGIAALVKSGKTTRASALTQIKTAVPTLAANVRRLLAGEPLRDVVDRGRGY